MNRRAFLRDASLLVGVLPFSARAQIKGRMPRIGFLSLQSKSDSRLEAFLAGMRQLGYIEGKTIAIEWRFTGGDAAPLPAYAAELLNLKPDLIVAVHPPAVEAGRRLTT